MRRAGSDVVRHVVVGIGDPGAWWTRGRDEGRSERACVEVAKDEADAVEARGGKHQKVAGVWSTLRSAKDSRVFAPRLFVIIFFVSAPSSMKKVCPIVSNTTLFVTRRKCTPWMATARLYV